MKTDKIKAQMRKGILELCVLSIISNKEAYPSDIINALKDNKLIVVEGTLYPLLKRLKDAAFLSYNWQESQSGPPRKYYQITDEGTNFLSELLSTWKDLNQAVSKSIKTIKTK